MNSNAWDGMRFALSSDIKIVHIDEVENGSKCECTCPACGSRLIAKNRGQVRGHHFAHHVYVDGSSCSETALHQAAKQLIVDQKAIRLPSLELWQESTKLDYLTFNDVETERRIETINGDKWIVVDCVGIYNTGELLIEIAVRHFIDEDKLAKIRLLDIPVIEINLADWARTLWTWENLAEAVLNDSQRRQWVYLPEWFREKLLPDTKDLEKEVVGSVNAHENIFQFGSMRVFVRDLPYGNLKVYHRPSPAIRKIVEPICRTRGYWNPKFKCWVVFDHFKKQILDELAAIKHPY